MHNVAPNAPAPDPYWQYSLQLPHDERAVPVARSTIRAVLQCYGMRSIADVAEMLTSELVTNAGRYSDGPAWLYGCAMSKGTA
jgi:anti-sigma regulatory factor (Ser/Thr protein kinase)